VERRKKAFWTNSDTSLKCYAFKLSPTLAVKCGVPTLAVKCGVKIEFKEAQNMLFIEQHTTIPVPKVYAAYSCKVLDSSGNPPPPSSKPEDDPVCTYIFMELVVGTTLDKIWDRWDEVTRLNVQNELKDYVRQMRDIPSEDYIGTLNRGPLRDKLLTYHTSDSGTMISSKSLSINLLANVPPPQVHLTAKKISTWRSATLTSRYATGVFSTSNAWMAYLAPTSTR